MQRKKRNRFPLVLWSVILIILICWRTSQQISFPLWTALIETDSVLSGIDTEETERIPGPEEEESQDILEEETDEIQEKEPVILSDAFYSEIPILMYHVVEDVPDGNSLYLSPEHFQEHLDYFDAEGIHPITMKDLYGHWVNGQALPEKPVVLTFDDGYRSMYTEVWPRLKEKGWPGVFYVYTKAIGQDTNLTVDMIKEMSDGGMEIGSHSVSHLDLSILSLEQLKSEIGDSKEILEEITGVPVTDFCYPSGSYDESARQTVLEAGYYTAVTTQYGVADCTEDLYGLSRIRISNGDNGSAVQAKLQGISGW